MTTLAKRKAALVSWAGTVDRTARLANARNAGPAKVEYHLARLGPAFDNATDAQRLAAAEAARRAHFTDLAMRSAQARRDRGAA